MKKTTYCLSFNGQNAVDSGYKFQNGYCYRPIYNHGDIIAQLEVVIDEPGSYNDLPCKWVDVSYIDKKNINAVINQLEKIGFKNQTAWLYEEDINGSMSMAKLVCGVKI